MVDDNKIMIFVYSDMQIAENKKIEKGLGKVFTCGNVTVKSKVSKYSDLIDEDSLSHMIALYPDTKIIYKGTLKSVTYTEVTHTSVRA